MVRPSEGWYQWEGTVAGGSVWPCYMEAYVIVHRPHINMGIRGRRRKCSGCLVVYLELTGRPCIASKWSKAFCTANLPAGRESPQSEAKPSVRPTYRPSMYRLKVKQSLLYGQLLFHDLVTTHRLQTQKAPLNTVTGVCTRQFLDSLKHEETFYKSHQTVQLSSSGNRTVVIVYWSHISTHQHFGVVEIKNVSTTIEMRPFCMVNGDSYTCWRL